MTKSVKKKKGRGDLHKTKRKLADSTTTLVPPNGDLSVLREQVKRLVGTIRELTPNEQVDKVALRRAAHQLAELSKQDELLELIVTEGAVEAVVPLLSLSGDPPTSSPKQDSKAEESTVPTGYEEVEKEACFILGLLAVKPEYQQKIAAAGALKGLVRLLKAHRISSTTRPQPGSGGVARRAADAITNLAHENVEIKNLVREEGGIPPLVALLDAWDVKVQRAAAGALRTLAFKNEDNKNQIVECGALPTLIQQMLRSEDPGVHYEAVGVIGNLVHSSQNIKRRVLDEGALQPVINLLSSTCAESQREAALLLGQFATTDADTKARIVQRGAVPPLITMLSASDLALKEMATFALGRLAQNGDNQAGIVHAGGLKPMLELLESKHPNLQHNAAFALYGLADNEDNVPDIIKEGGLQLLMECNERLTVQTSKDCISKTINRIEQKLQGNNNRVLTHVIYMLRSSDKLVQQRVATSLARHAPQDHLKTIFVDRRGLDVLQHMLTDKTVEPKQQREAATALFQLAEKVHATAPINTGPSQPTKTVYLGEQYVNNPTLADVTFVVEGRKFHAHRIALLASSDAFRAMFNSSFREKEASTIDIPNISWPVFEAMMHYVYTGHVEVSEEIARELLIASDQYLLEGLKRLCEMAIASTLKLETLVEVYDLAERFSAPALGKQCVMFALKHYDEIFKAWESSGYADIMCRMGPLLKASITEELTKCDFMETAE